MGSLYVIFNLISGNRYIGSSYDIEHRFRHHRWALKNNKHDNDHLQKSWNKYGEDAFVFAVVKDNIPDELLPEKEQELIEKIPYSSLYNISNFAYLPSDTTGRKLSSEHIEKIRNSHLGRVVSEETKKKISLSRSKPYPAFINRITREIIPEGIGLASMCREHGFSIPRMCAVVRGYSHSHHGWMLYDKSKRKPLGSENPYPKMINEITGEIIPAGQNIHELCRERNFTRSSITAVIKGKYKQYKGWTLMKEDQNA
jgi:group I intron endonuclease